VNLSDQEKHIVEELTCIVCPKSCVLRVEKDKISGTITAIHNANCQRGIAWVTQELLHPTRSVCSSVLVENGTEPLTGVRTNQPVSRDDVFKVMGAIKSCRISAPVAIGAIVLENPGGVPCRVIATRAVGREDRKLETGSRKMKRKILIQLPT